ncbi:MAG: hypothetical protein AAF919_00180 [Pseudomonadota bacterium]
MLLKIVSLFLIGMVVLAMFGRLRWPGPLAKAAPRRCRACKSLIVGRKPCPCGRS